MPNRFHYTDKDGLERHPFPGGLEVRRKQT